ncbi:hypothetical protein HY008_01095 [Candidatus Woesebacteria bacterium]|nr:hypothetical protein [Candidatus Woesebacteria bacterium]
MRVINIELNPIVEASDLAGQELTSFSEKTVLKPEDIRMAPWPMVLTQWHLVSMAGSPPNAIFEKLYRQS